MAQSSEKTTTNLCPSKTPPWRCGTDLTIHSPAKINLTLDILGKDNLNYHLVDTVLQEINLTDELIFKQIPENKIIIECNDLTVPTDHTNTIHKAVSILQSGSSEVRDSKLPGLLITLKKNIPVASGLGGGSSNAAATLKALNKLWNLNLSNQELRRLGAQIGVDVPFFIEGGTAFGTHYGEEIKPLPTFQMPPHLIIIDEEKRSTKEAYKALNLSKTGKNTTKTQQFIESLQKSEPDTSLFHNDFTQSISQRTQSLQKKLLQLQATLVRISGSGPALYALFSSDNQLVHAYQELKGQVRFIWQNQNKK